MRAALQYDVLAERCLSNIPLALSRIAVVESRHDFWTLVRFGSRLGASNYLIFRSGMETPKARQMV